MLARSDRDDFLLDCILALFTAQSSIALGQHKSPLPAQVCHKSAIKRICDDSGGGVPLRKGKGALAKFRQTSLGVDGGHWHVGQIVTLILGLIGLPRVASVILLMQL